jgi:hypothetical protein
MWNGFAWCGPAFPFFTTIKIRAKDVPLKKRAFGGLVGIALKQFCRIPRAIIFLRSAILETKNDGMGTRTPCQEKKLRREEEIPAFLPGMTG